jgi:hypothetical protein
MSLAETVQNLESKVEALTPKFESLFTTFEKFAPFLSAIPGAAPVVTDVEVASGVVEHLIDSAEGNAATDAAALAAGQIAVSTGNGTLDNRIATIELFIENLGPFLESIAKEVGLQAPATPATVAAASATTTA